jgi:hypothetical protein
MKSFIALFLIAIISCSSNSPILKDKEPIDVIKCILSNKDLFNQLKEIILEIEDLINDKNFSGLVKLLNLFPMIEEVKACFDETPVEPQPVEDPVLKGPIDDFIGCVGGAVGDVLSDVMGAVSKIEGCWNDLPEETKNAIINSGVDALSVACKAALSGHPLAGEICNIVCNLLNSF